ncbi:MAG: hypothetical protein WD004_08625 [Actinomycetota bacterium]
MKRTSTLAGIALVTALVLSGCASKVEQDLDALDEAQATGGSILLQQAAVTASGWYATNGSYAGFNASTAKSLDPALKWADGGAPAVGVVTIEGASATSVQLLTSDDSGGSVCIQLNEGIDTPC